MSDSKRLETASATAAAIEIDPRAWRRSSRRFAFRFADPLEADYRADIRKELGLRRGVVTALFGGFAAGLYWLLPALGALRIAPSSYSGLLLYALVLPALLAATLTALLPPLRRFSDATVLAALVVAGLAPAAIRWLEQAHQPFAVPMAVAVLYPFVALILFRLPAGQAVVAAILVTAAQPPIAGGGHWPGTALQREALVLMAFMLPAAFAAFCAERDGRRAWLSERLLQTAARQDFLTGLLNRRSFEAEAAVLLARAARNGSSCALLLLDIDFFKAINDLYGHAHGDQVLKDVAGVIGRAGRNPDDLCARYGGEEFTILWTDCSAATARRNAETVLLEIRRLQIENSGSSVAPTVTASAGLIAWETDAAGDIADGIGQADHLLYLAKRNGRNRLVTPQSAEAAT